MKFSKQSLKTESWNQYLGRITTKIIFYFFLVKEGIISESDSLVPGRVLTINSMGGQTMRKKRDAGTDGPDGREPPPGLSTQTESFLLQQPVNSLRLQSHRYESWR